MPHSLYMREKIGSAVINPSDPVVAGSFTSFDFVYTAGYFGLDDTGSIKIVHRFATDMGQPQFSEPNSLHYVSIEASNRAVLSYHFDVKNNIRPWGKTLYIKVVKGFMKEGDQIIVHYGDRRQGSPGLRMQTFCEDAFEFKCLVDAFALYDYVELPVSPLIKIIPGAPFVWKAILPTTRLIGQSFRLALKTEDLWGNPSDRVDSTVFLAPNHPIANLPEKVTMRPGQWASVIDGLNVNTERDVFIDIFDEKGNHLTRSNPLRIVRASDLLPYWADMHGQSEETIGTNSARDYFLFGRDRSFLDAICHQGNDFQITRGFWSDLQRLTAEFHEPGRFIPFPGYEWSGNTGLGGDHNVIYFSEGEPIYRSSHAQVYDYSDADTDRYTTRDLFTTLKDKDAFIYAHVGGRYADLKLGGNLDVPLAIEIHSAWGTFEWLLHDAFDLGLRVGIVANSDDHKGRPGASFPGASMFGSYGGLTCFLCPELTRQGIFESLRSRHHYATTGARILLHTWLGHEHGKSEAIMGDIVLTKAREVLFHVDSLCQAPVERVDIFDGKDLIETYKPFDPDSLGQRICIIWEGAEYRGRGRETRWDGFAELDENSFENALPINFWNPERSLRHDGPDHISWQSVTTGGFSGFHAVLGDPFKGILKIHTPLVKDRIPVSEICYEDTMFEAGGLGRRIRIFRLNDHNPATRVRLSRKIPVRSSRTHPLYVRLTQEDGHRAWSSPIYVIGG